MVDAANCRVTTSSLPLDFTHTLNLGHTNFSLRPLYSEDIIQYNYSLLQATVTTEPVAIQILFRFLDVLEAYQVETFPFSHDGQGFCIIFHWTVPLFGVL